MEELRSETETTIKNFLIYSTMKVIDEDKFVISKLDSINREKDGFKEFVEKSIAESTKLHVFAESLIVFADSCEDHSIDHADLLVALKTLKDDAINNRRSAIELKSEITQIKRNLENIHMELIKYNEKILRNEKDMMSTTRDKLIKKGTQIENSSSIAKKSLIAAGAGLGVSLLALPFTGGVSAVAASLEVTICADILFGLGLGTFSLGTTSAGVFKGIPTAQYYYINYKLQGERDKLTHQVGELNKGLAGVYDVLSKFESRLSDQEVYISDLIKKLEKHEYGSNGRIPRIIARIIAKSWKKISQEALQYSSIMRKLLQDDSKLNNQQLKMVFI
ncbi:17284_t:CDS:1 [Entrophospora sp. SA101]|nr:2677_t:CDS:1 [Entrophospora sp. SA101]CAJ0643281.1 1115_t:CDS:1 [Entrophospora sp. SA101]CAJ0756629.1 17284_t:CDS:1 [Entrophospora sp. SA101]CAJ0829494.1 3965_t:CDS:1 [Entrophospora sp. SA101]CAJ0905824.1 7862_t:CDS:1 [Entrophospora sp. SA101]